MEEKSLWLALSQDTFFGYIRFQKLLQAFGSLANAWQADASTLLKFVPDLADQFIKIRTAVNPDEIAQKIEDLNSKFVILTDPEYPALLKEIYNPPPVLYYKGTLTKNDEFCLSVVGSRKCSDYGQNATRDIVKGLAQAGITIVSGLALGIDALAHFVALENQARTIGVLGCGIDIMYPATNKQLGERILAEGGTILSEFPPGTPTLKQNFPARNRIISGLSLGVLIVEAAEDSGSLITARHALEQDREVFAVPGNFYNPLSVGPNNLLKMGAHPVTCADDILQTLHLENLSIKKQARAILPDSPAEAKLLPHLESPINFDELVQKSQMTPSEVNATLTLMEMKGKIRNLGSATYVIAR
jgi:DNA processing protein